MFVSEPSTSTTFTYSAEIFVPTTNINPEFEITLNSGIPPLTVFFDASSTTVVGSNAEDLSYIWTFADGSTAEGINVEKTFNRAGETDVLLTVSNGSVQAQVQKTITVQTPENEDGTLTMRPEEGYVFSKHGVAVMSINEAIQETINITVKEVDSPEDVEAGINIVNAIDLDDDRIEVISPIYSISSDKEVTARGGNGQIFGLAITVPKDIDPRELAIISVTRGKYILPPTAQNFWDLSDGSYLPNQSIFYTRFVWLSPEPKYIALVRTDGGFFCTGSECSEDP
ncbi:MAG: PKD domain-containing protein [Deinococcota bacterium]